jgi:hypothetical protein
LGDIFFAMRKSLAKIGADTKVADRRALLNIRWSNAWFWPRACTCLTSRNWSTGTTTSVETEMWGSECRRSSWRSWGKVAMQLHEDPLTKKASNSLYFRENSPKRVARWFILKKRSVKYAA